ncbi:HNH endonuclease [Cytobacillus sp. Sa5YUA1]|uniref:HNH endonuclease n=1 Tax=Cytobacillus stercorigallinarum TaxID=2762240 RepID=A0ABR8QKG6_9BACI|nr:HNH endonuclease [Cytobacillus stercorigallinarum]
MDIRTEFQTVRKQFLNQLEKKECFNCGTTSEAFHVHHIVPLAIGGTNRLTNLSLLCEACHGLVHGADFTNRKKLQAEGIAVAKAKGKHLGRPVLELPKEWDKLYKEWKAGKITAVAFMDTIGMKKATFYKKVKEYELAL